MYTSASQIRAELDLITNEIFWEKMKFSIPPQILERNATLKKLSEKNSTEWTAEEQESYQKETLAEYCWVAYSKSFSSVGDMVIGRQNDLARQGLYEKVADLVKPETSALPTDSKQTPTTSTGVPNLTLLDEGTHGNLLNQDKWAKSINDAWLIGGIHRKAKFRISSTLTMNNLWNQSGQDEFLVVTAREMLGLLHYGYELHQVGPWKIFILPANNFLQASRASLVDYANHVLNNSSKYNAIKLSVIEPIQSSRHPIQSSRPANQTVTLIKTSWSNF
jgi:hypothetical protein